MIQTKTQRKSKEVKQQRPYTRIGREHVHYTL